MSKSFQAGDIVYATSDEYGVTSYQNLFVGIVLSQEALGYVRIYSLFSILQLNLFHLLHSSNKTPSEKKEIIRFLQRIRRNVDHPYTHDELQSLISNFREAINYDSCYVVDSEHFELVDSISENTPSQLFEYFQTTCEGNGMLFLRHPKYNHELHLIEDEFKKELSNIFQLLEFVKDLKPIVSDIKW